MIFAMAWRNLWRRPTRTALSLAGMAFASMLLVFMLSFQFGVYAGMKSKVLGLFDGFAQVQPAGYAADPGLQRSIKSPDALAAGISRRSGITGVSPRASAFVILSHDERSYGGELVGVEPGHERAMSSLPRTVRAGRFLRQKDDAAIVMGDALARNLKIHPGDKVTILGSARDGSVAADSLVLVGTFHSGIKELDRHVSEVPLARFQSTFAMSNRANFIVLSGSSLPRVDAGLPALRRMVRPLGLVVRDWGQLQPGLKQAITLDFSTAMLWYASLVIVVVFIILNTLLMSVLERTRELGMLMAIGMKPALIGRMMWIELLLLALLGNGIGIFLGGAATLWFQAYGIPIGKMSGVLSQWGLSGRLYPALSVTSALAGPLVIVASVAVAGLIPYRRLRGMDPLRAMRAH